MVVNEGAVNVADGLVKNCIDCGHVVVVLDVDFVSMDGDEV